MSANDRLRARRLRVSFLAGAALACVVPAIRAETPAPGEGRPQPSNQHRIEALQRHFREKPSVFGSFNPERSSATPFSIPKKTAVVFLR
jgi:hypothetical protein